MGMGGKWISGMDNLSPSVDLALTTIVVGASLTSSTRREAKYSVM